jgi:hypothetical protein
MGAETPMARTATKQENLQFDRIAATCAGLGIIGLVVFLLVRNEKIADPRLFFALRVVLSFAAAVLGASIPGFLEIGWKSGRDLSVRAGGALALFVLTYVYTPDLVAEQVTINAPNGVAAKDIHGGTFNIGPPPAAPPPTSSAAP